MISRIILGTIVITAVLIGCKSFFALSKYVHLLEPARNECVILLHGLCRSALSMKRIERLLKLNGYAVININYDSTRKTITRVADEAVASAVSGAMGQGYERIHFVTHSLGAIVVRSYLQEHQLPAGSRIVMLAPPNQGSELADWALAKFPRLSRLAGPAARQLGTGDQTLLSKLNPIIAETGIIIGNDSWNPFYSKILPGSDDGKVTVARAKLEEMRDFQITSCNHTTILIKKEVLQQVLYFLQHGHFHRSAQLPTNDLMIAN